MYRQYIRTVKNSALMSHFTLVVEAKRRNIDEGIIQHLLSSLSASLSLSMYISPTSITPFAHLNLSRWLNTFKLMIDEFIFRRICTLASTVDFSAQETREQLLVCVCVYAIQPPLSSLRSFMQPLSHIYLLPHMHCHPLASCLQDGIKALPPKKVAKPTITDKIVMASRSTEADMLQHALQQLRVDRFDATVAEARLLRASAGRTGLTGAVGHDDRDADGDEDDDESEDSDTGGAGQRELVSERKDGVEIELQAPEGVETGSDGRTCKRLRAVVSEGGKIESAGDFFNFFDVVTEAGERRRRQRENESAGSERQSRGHGDKTALVGSITCNGIAMERVRKLQVVGMGGSVMGDVTEEKGESGEADDEEYVYDLYYTGEPVAWEQGE